VQGGGHDSPGGFGAHGNPRDFELMLARLADPGRARWQRPRQLVRALGLRPGETVAEIGAGSRYVVRRLARETFLRDARRAGLRLVREATFLSFQYCVVLRPR
jgi:hypothetical protein